MSWWKRSESGTRAADKKPVPEGVWSKCEACGEILLESDFTANLLVCPACGHHRSIDGQKRLALLIDQGTFAPIAEDTQPLDPLKFKDSKRYTDRIKAAGKKSGLTEAAIAGQGQLDGIDVMIGILAFEYMGGSMGSVVGERVTQVFEHALERGLPAIICSASGGARMQEGILSLMQMAKTTSALTRLRAAGLPYLSVLLHPTTGGVAASFSMLGDINISEPGALIGFAGQRVIEQTIRQKLPEGFQRSEFLLDHGMLDMIVPRDQLKATLARLLRTLLKQPAADATGA